MYVGFCPLPLRHTCLYMACGSGHAAAVWLLLDAGVVVRSAALAFCKQVPHSPQAAGHWPAEPQSVEVPEGGEMAPRHGVSSRVTCCHGQGLSHQCRWPHPHVVRALLDLRPPDISYISAAATIINGRLCACQEGTMPLHSAISGGHTEAARVLLAAGAFVDPLDVVRRPSFTNPAQRTCRTVHRVMHDVKQMMI